MGEGFSDYLAAAIAEEFAQRDDYDECFAEWDYSFVDLTGDPPCLRRVDRDITFAQAQAGQGCSRPGRVHLLRGRGVVGRAVGHPHDARDRRRRSPTAR